MEKEQSIKEFSCKSATIYFIYSFLFSKIDDMKRSTKIIEEALKSEGYSPKAPSGRGDFEPYLKICEDSIEFDFFHREAEIVREEKQQKNVDIEKNIILYQTGAGIYTIKAIINRALKVEELIEFSLIADDETCKIKFGETSKDKYLFQLFKDDIELIATNWKSRSGKDIWFERKEKLIDPNEHYQNPFVYIEFELPEEIYREAFLGGTKYQKEISAILFRLKVKEDWEYIDESYLRKYEDVVDSKLANMHLYSKLFASFHTRSCIAVCTDKKYPPATYFLPALFDTVQLIRSRWHSYIIYNKYLDNKIKQLYKNYNVGGPAIPELLEDIISIREDLSSALEDPITWRRASGSLYTIYEAGLKKFRIEILEKIMIEKMGMLDRLFENVKESRFRRNIAEIEKKQRSWKRKLWFFLAFLFFGGGLGLLFSHKMLFNIPLTGLIPFAIGVVLLVYWLKGEERFEEEKSKETQE